MLWPASPAMSGWQVMARDRYADLMSICVASSSTPRICAPHRAYSHAWCRESVSQARSPYAGGLQLAAPQRDSHSATAGTEQIDIAPHSSLEDRWQSHTWRFQLWSACKPRPRLQAVEPYVSARTCCQRLYSDPAHWGSGHVDDTKLKRAKRVQVGCTETPERLRVSAHSVTACSELTNTRWSAARRFARSPRRRSRCTRRHGFAERCCCVGGGHNPLKAEHTRSPAGARLGLVCIAAHCPCTSTTGPLTRTGQILVIISARRPL